MAGNGPQRGYFVNEHADGDRDFGTFEGKISTAGGQVTIEGSWKFVDGTGKYKTITRQRHLEGSDDGGGTGKDLARNLPTRGKNSSSMIFLANPTLPKRGRRVGSGEGADNSQSEGE